MLVASRVIFSVSASGRTLAQMPKFRCSWELGERTPKHTSIKKAFACHFPSLARKVTDLSLHSTRTGQSKVGRLSYMDPALYL